jgi:hypothetical protein
VIDCGGTEGNSAKAARSQSEVGNNAVACSKPPPKSGFAQDRPLLFDGIPSQCIHLSMHAQKTLTAHLLTIVEVWQSWRLCGVSDSAGVEVTAIERDRRRRPARQSTPMKLVLATVGIMLFACSSAFKLGRSFTQSVRSVPQIATAPLRRARFASFASVTDTSEVEVVASIKAKGDIIRELKASKADKDAIVGQVMELKALKSKYEEICGKPFDTPSVEKVGKAAKEVKEKTAVSAKEKTEAPSGGGSGGADSVVITPRTVDYSAWYNDVIYAADMVDQSPVRGCMVIKPWGMGVWDLLRNDLDNRIRDTGT